MGPTGHGSLMVAAEALEALHVDRLPGATFARENRQHAHAVVGHAGRNRDSSHLRERREQVDHAHRFLALSRLDSRPAHEHGDADASVIDAALRPAEGSLTTVVGDEEDVARVVLEQATDLAVEVGEHGEDGWKLLRLAVRS